MQALMCMRVMGLKSPFKDSVKGHYCCECKHEVWVRLRNLCLQLKILCRECAESHKQMASRLGGRITIYPAKDAFTRN